MGRNLVFAAAWITLTTLGIAAEPVAAANASRWSKPSVLARCGIVGGPLLAFPSDSPNTPSGAGAIVWASDPSTCRASRSAPSAGSLRLAVAALGAGDRARLSGTQPLAVRSGDAMSLVGASLGRLALAAEAGPGQADAAVAVFQGDAHKRLEGWTSPARSGPPPALTRAYLGDVAIAATVPGPAIAVRVERYFQKGFGPPRIIPVTAGPITSLTVTMDYRSDVLLAWQQHGAIYARMLHASGRSDPIQRIGASERDPQLQAVVSDNDHGMIAWSSTRSAGGSTPRTRVYLALSDAGVRFRAPQLLAAFADPERVGHLPGCLALVRLSTENVVLAWTAAEHGTYVIRGAPAVYAASRPATRLSDAHVSAILAGLAPGPAGEAIALSKRAPLPGRAFDPKRTELWAQRTFVVPHDRLAALTPSMIAATGAHATSSIAVDPADDRAVAAWLTRGAQPRLEYAVGSGAPGYRPHPLAALSPARAGVHWLRITLAVVGGLALATLALAASSTARRRRSR